MPQLHHNPSGTIFGDHTPGHYEWVGTHPTWHISTPMFRGTHMNIDQARAIQAAYPEGEFDILDPHGLFAHQARA